MASDSPEIVDVPSGSLFYSFVGAAFRVVGWAALAALAIVLALQLVFFGVHAAHLLGYAYPLDYGEGPLLAQVDLLRAGTPVWRLYADPGQPPYAVVNYPPVYHLVAAALATLTQNTLLAGRLVALGSALAAVAALWLLAGLGDRDKEPRRQEQQQTRRQGDKETKSLLVSLSPCLTSLGRSIARTLIVLSFLGLPIVREWAVVMRVDLLGVALGLWALVIVRRSSGRRAVLWAAPLLALSLLVKPSLIAAPAAGLLWLMFRDWRRALLLGGLAALLSGLIAALMQLGSGGWFLLHVLAANANPWDRKLAYNFWRDQLLIVWPLVAAAALGTMIHILHWRTGNAGQEPRTGTRRVNQEPAGALMLALTYTLFGALVALGVGKVGAYANYFLEFYAGLIWLTAASTARLPTTDDRRLKQPSDRWRWVVGRHLALALVVLLVIAAQLRYYPTWSETYLKLAGIIEGRNPARVIVGGHGVWQDLQRERDILATLAGVNAALDREVRAAGAPIFTDVPGVAAQSGRLARLQAFEYRQLLDAGLADQHALLRDMANGRVPLVVLDYLGNWLTPEMIAMITHRYAQDGSRGTYDLYRPVDPGPAVQTEHDFPAGLHLIAYHLAAAPGQAAFHGGETALLTLDWRASAAPRDPAGYEVLVRLTNGQGQTVLELAQPLLYGALPPEAWGDEAMQHLQAIELPPELPPATYQLAVTLRSGGRDLVPAQIVAPLVVAPPDGRQLGERGYYVPAPLLDAWQRLGGDAPTGSGDPLMPATPFAGYTLQCFMRACLRLEHGVVQRVALGEPVHLADVGLRPAGAGDASVIGAGFRGFWDANGGEAAFGPPLTPELIRGDQIVQYTRYARLERPLGGGAVRLGPLGDEFLRLPGGVPYRWPAP